jgi:hypothetical protein
MLYYERSELDRRIGGGDAAEEQLWQLLRRHRLTPLHSATTVADVERQMAALDGTAFTKERGYDGPGAGAGDGVFALGAYGELGPPSAGGLGAVERIVGLLAARGVLAKTDVFVYAADEDCTSPFAAGWKALLSTSREPDVRRVRVAWTCGEDPDGQPADIPIQQDTFDPRRAAVARVHGKEVWVYNGVRPFAATFLTDSEAASLRANGWIAAMFDVGRWFYWETTFWYDANKGGHGPYDPFATAETFHNADGDACMGDGVLLYPGKQIDVGLAHSVGFAGVLPSIRLKNWRRGIEDAGYYQLARAGDSAKANAIAKRLLPAVWREAHAGDPASWSDVGKAWFDARMQLLALIPKGADASIVATMRDEPPARGVSNGAIAAGVAAVLALLVGLLAVRTQRRR